MIVLIILELHIFTLKLQALAEKYNKSSVCNFFHDLHTRTKSRISVAHNCSCTQLLSIDTLSKV